MDPTPVEELGTGITGAFEALGPVAVPVALAAIPIALLFWGGPKLKALFKRMAG